MVITQYNSTITVTGTPTTGTLADGSTWIAGSYELTAVGHVQKMLNRFGARVDNNDAWDNTLPMYYNDGTGEQGASSGAQLSTSPDTLQGFCTEPRYAPGADLANGKIYTSSLDLSRTINLPVTIPAGKTLICATGQELGGVIRSVTNEIVALTGFATAPAANSFRMNVYTNVLHPAQYTEADINYGILQNLPPVPNMPTTAQIAAHCPLGLPWYEFDSAAAQSGRGPANNYATDGLGLSYPNSSEVYGGNVARKWSKVALWLNCDQAGGGFTSNQVKRNAVVYTIQCGLDIASFIRNGGIFQPDGGHKYGRLFPVLFAGLALNDATLLAMVASNEPPYFNEKSTVFFIGASDVDRVVLDMENGAYVSGDVTDPPKAEWGIRHYFSPFYDDRRLGATYRYTWGETLGQVLAIHLMGASGHLNMPAVSAYNLRYRTEINTPEVFAGQMWDAYYNSVVVAVPTHSVASSGMPRGLYSLDSSRLVTLTGVGVTTSIRYTIGAAPADPTADTGTLYTAPFSTGTTNCIIKWRAFRTGADPSAVGSITVNFTTSGHPSAPVNIDVS